MTTQTATFSDGTATNLALIFSETFPAAMDVKTSDTVEILSSLPSSAAARSVPSLKEPDVKTFGATRSNYAVMREMADLVSQRRVAGGPLFPDVAAAILEFCRALGLQADDTVAERFLSEALDELKEVREYAKESDLPPPSPQTIKLARRILKQVVRDVPLYYSVSPGERGKIAIQAADNQKNAVMILCDASGGASCYVSIAGENRHMHYDSARDFPDSSVLEALRALEPSDE